MRVWVGMIALSLTTTALAEPKDCRAITDPKERLTCFDAQPAAPEPKVRAPADPIIAKARAAVARVLIDPPSARFEGIVRRPEAVCGFVNSKNRMGGYSGRVPFLYMIKENQAWVFAMPVENYAHMQRGLSAAELHCAKVPGF